MEYILRRFFEMDMEDDYDDYDDYENIKHEVFKISLFTKIIIIVYILCLDIFDGGRAGKHRLTCEKN